MLYYMLYFDVIEMTHLAFLVISESVLIFIPPITGMAHAA